GVVVVRLPPDEFSRVVTGSMAWERDGLGATGEVYLAGADGRLRSESRFHLEDPDGYLDTLRKAGYPKQQIDEVRRSETTILTQEARGEAQERALEGHTATEVVHDYRGVKVLAAYAPLDVEGRRCVIVAQQDV